MVYYAVDSVEDAQVSEVLSKVGQHLQTGPLPTKMVSAGPATPNHEVKSFPVCDDGKASNKLSCTASSTKYC